MSLVAMQIADEVESASALSLALHIPAPNVETQNYLCKRRSPLDNTFINLRWPHRQDSRRSQSAPCSLRVLQDPAPVTPKVSPSEVAQRMHKDAAKAVPDFTTVIIRNLPEYIDQAGVQMALANAGFEGKYDFLYVPMRFKDGTCQGYGFINFKTPLVAAEFEKRWHGSKVFCGYGHKKALAVD
eukprot:6455579-Amphidinium_carterae.1